MKILDFLTMASLTEAKIPYRINKFAIDPKSEVYPIERGTYLIVSESEKLGNDATEKFSMYLATPYSTRFLQGFNSEQEVEAACAKLISGETFDISRNSSSLYDELEESLNGPEKDR